MIVIPRCAIAHLRAMRSIEPGIHRAVKTNGEMDSGFALRVPRNDDGGIEA